LRLDMRTLLALVATLLLALGAAAQSATEFGRASGGDVKAITKAPRQTSGTLGLTHSNRGLGYEGSLGGELVDDRLWFFAAASVLPRTQFSTSELTAIDGKATAQPVDWTSVTAAFSHVFPKTPVTPLDGALPTSFLSLRSTSVLSDRMTLDVSVTRTR
jgi:hypothetical protein